MPVSPAKLRLARYLAALECSEDAVVLTTPEPRILFVSQAIETIFGFSPDAIRTRQARITMHPDDMLKERPRQIAALNAEGARYLGEARYRHADGSWRWMRATIANFRTTPDVLVIIEWYRDIQAQKVLESRG